MKQIKWHHGPARVFLIAESKGIITLQLDEWMMLDTMIEFMQEFLSSCLLLSKLSRPFLLLHMCNKLIQIFLNNAGFVYQSNKKGTVIAIFIAYGTHQNNLPG